MQQQAWPRVGLISQTLKRMQQPPNVVVVVYNAIERRENDRYSWERDNERSAMLATTKTRHHTHRIENESDIIVWLSVYLQFRLNETDWSIDIDHHHHSEVWSNRNVKTAAVAVAAPATATAATASAVASKKKEYHHGWNKKYCVLFWENWKLWRFRSLEK